MCLPRDYVTLNYFSHYFSNYVFQLFEATERKKIHLVSRFIFRIFFNWFFDLFSKLFSTLFWMYFPNVFQLCFSIYFQIIFNFVLDLFSKCFSTCFSVIVTRVRGQDKGPLNHPRWRDQEGRWMACDSKTDPKLRMSFCYEIDAIIGNAMQVHMSCQSRKLLTRAAMNVMLVDAFPWAGVSHRGSGKRFAQIFSSWMLGYLTSWTQQVK